MGYSRISEIVVTTTLESLLVSPTELTNTVPQGASLGVSGDSAPAGVDGGVTSHCCSRQ